MAETKQCPICKRQFFVEYPAQKFCYKAGCETKKDNPIERIRDLEEAFGEYREHVASMTPVTWTRGRWANIAHEWEKKWKVLDAKAQKLLEGE